MIQLFMEQLSVSIQGKQNSEYINKGHTKKFTKALETPNMIEMDAIAP